MTSKQESPIKPGKLVVLDATKFTLGIKVGFVDTHKGSKMNLTTHSTTEEAVGQVVKVVSENDVKQVLVIGFPEQRDVIASLVGTAIDQVLEDDSVQIFFQVAIAKDGGVDSAERTTD